MIVLTETNLRKNSGAGAVGRAKLVECPRCLVSAGQKCRDAEGRELSPFHLECGQVARYAEMLRP